MSAGKFAAGAAAFLLLSGGVLAVAGHYMGAEHELTIQRDGWSVEVSPFSLHGLNSEGWETGWDGWSQDRTPGTVPDRPVWRVPTKYRNEVETVSVAPEAFTRLHIDADISDVIVEQGDAYGLELNWYSNVGYTMDWYQNGDALEVYSRLPNNSLKGNNQVGGLVVVTLPEGAVLDDVNVTMDMGDLYMADVRTGTATLESSMGETAFLRGAADQMTVRADMGSFVLADSAVSGVLDVTASMGDVELIDSRVSEKILVDCDMGGVILSGELACDMDVTSSMGSVDVYTGLARDQYTYDLSASMGDLKLDGVRQKEEHVRGGAGSYRMSISTDMGSASVHFGGGSYIPEAPEAPEAADEIVDLPNELYRAVPEHDDKSLGMSAGVLSYDFAVQDTTRMDMDVENLSGVLELGIRRAVGGWAYDQRPWDSESDSVELEPGRYTVVIHAEAFQGSYHLTGETVA